MNLSLRPHHLRRYASIAHLLVKYGHSDLVRDTGLEAALDGRGGTEQEAAGSAAAADLADQLPDDLTELGPTYVKLGQLLSTRADLVPPAYLSALRRLQDDVAPVPLPEVEQVLVDQLGAEAADRFATFDPIPMASASIGQVHRASLPDGRPVAVKVQRPGIRAAILDDLEVLAQLADFADEHTEAGRIYGFGDLLEQFRHSLLAELDYRVEAENLRTMRAHLDDFHLIVVPRPIDELSTGKVLTMELIDGEKVTDAAAIPDGPALARQLFDAYLGQILTEGLVHADPHPGNVLVTSDGRLGLIDLGMVARLDPQVRVQLTKLMLALSEGRGHDVAEILQGLGRELRGFDADTFRAGVSELVGRHATDSVRDLGAGTVVAELMAVCGSARLRPPPDLAMIGKALLDLDEVTRTLDPGFEPAEAMREHGEELMRHELSSTIGDMGWARSLLEGRELVEALPRRIRGLLDALVDGELTIKVDAIDEEEMFRGVEKVANRLTMGLLLAATIIGAAMTMSVDTTSTLFGYPSISILFFVGAGIGGVVLMASIVLADHRRRRRTR